MVPEHKTAWVQGHALAAVRAIRRELTRPAHRAFVPGDRVQTERHGGVYTVSHVAAGRVWLQGASLWYAPEELFLVR